MDFEFDLGLRTLRATLHHIVRNTEVWTDLMAGRPVRSDGDRSIDALQARLDRAAADFAELAHGVQARDGWDEVWTDTLDDPPRQKTFGGAIAHLLTHSMHHRGQAIHMLRQLDVADVPEGDVLSWENQHNERR